MEWINCKHQMPLDEEDYLCLFIGWDDMLFMRVLNYDFQDNCWYGHTGFGKYETVTHWMPLPEPPVN